MKLIKTLFLSTLITSQIFCSYGFDDDDEEEPIASSHSFQSSPLEAPPAYVDTELNTRQDLPIYSTRPMSAERAVWYFFDRKEKVNVGEVLDIIEALDPIDPAQMKTFVESVRFLAEDGYSHKFKCDFLSYMARIQSEEERSSLAETIRPYILKPSFLKRIPEQPFSIIESIFKDLSAVPIDRRKLVSERGTHFITKEMLSRTTPELESEGIVSKLIHSTDKIPCPSEEVDLFVEQYRKVCKHFHASSFIACFEYMNSLPNQEKRTSFIKSILCYMKSQRLTSENELILLSQFKKMFGTINLLQEEQVLNYQKLTERFEKRNYSETVLMETQHLLRFLVVISSFASYEQFLDLTEGFRELQLLNIFVAFRTTPPQRIVNALKLIELNSVGMNRKQKEGRFLELLNEEETPF